MKPETEQQRQDRERALKEACEAMGLVCSGSIVVAPLGSPVAVDASAIDMGNIAACLMYLAYAQGMAHGRQQMREDMRRLLADD